MMEQRHVKVDDRKFIATMREDGTVHMIHERVLHAAGMPWECLADKIRWHSGHSDVPQNPNALYARVIAAAQASR